jgi:hypothetical protein
MSGREAGVPAHPDKATETRTRTLIRAFETAHAVPSESFDRLHDAVIARAETVASGLTRHKQYACGLEISINQTGPTGGIVFSVLNFARGEGTVHYTPEAADVVKMALQPGSPTQPEEQHTPKGKARDAVRAFENAWGITSVAIDLIHDAVRKQAAFFPGGLPGDLFTANGMEVAIKQTGPKGGIVFTVNNYTQGKGSVFYTPEAADLVNGALQRARKQGSELRTGK